VRRIGARDKVGAWSYAGPYTIEANRTATTPFAPAPHAAAARAWLRGAARII